MNNQNDEILGFSFFVAVQWAAAQLSAVYKAKWGPVHSHFLNHLAPEVIENFQQHAWRRNGGSCDDSRMFYRQGIAAEQRANEHLRETRVSEDQIRILWSLARCSHEHLLENITTHEPCNVDKVLLSMHQEGVVDDLVLVAGYPKVPIKVSAFVGILQKRALALDLAAKENQTKD